MALKVEEDSKGIHLTVCCYAVLEYLLHGRYEMKNVMYVHRSLWTIEGHDDHGYGFGRALKFCPHCGERFTPLEVIRRREAEKELEECKKKKRR